MNTYLFLGTYTASGRKALLAEGGTAREKVTHELFEGKVGGKVRHYAFCEGEYDFIVLVDLPNDDYRSAVSLLTTSGGHISVKSLKLVSPSQMDEIAKLANNLVFREPGR